MSQDSVFESWKRSIAEAVSAVISRRFTFPVGAETANVAHVCQLLERPRNASHGDFALPLFHFSKTLGVPPQKIFDEIRDDLAKSLVGSACEPAGSYINFRLASTVVAADVLSNAIDAATFGSGAEGHGQTALVEFSSPNIAKPFGIGHLRSTILGASLARIFSRLGYQTVRINYLGDWGTQFGKMIVAYRRWGGAEALKADPDRGAYNLYVRFHEEEDNDPTLGDDARAAFRALEAGDPETRSLWNMFREVSWREFARVYELLGIEFDQVTSESFLNDRMEAVIARLEKAGLTSESRGALIVDLERFGLPACLLKKQDGATLYATRDLAGMLYRWETYRFAMSLYVVGSAQADHFKQFFKVIELLEDAEKVPVESRMSTRVKHVPFGWVKFEDKALSTRRGNLIFLEDVLTKSIQLARDKIAEKNPDLVGADEVARKVGVSAIIFSQISVRKQKDVNFAWERALSFEGETGPYLQYTHARLASLIRKYGKPVPEYDSVDSGHYENTESHELLFTIGRFPDVVRQAARECEPFLIAEYLLTLASLFNTYYQRKDSDGRIIKIISDDSAATSARIRLVRATQVTLAAGLSILGIEAPEEM